MIVYGDRERSLLTAHALADLERSCAGLAATPAVRERTEAATSLLIAAGELAQGLLDAACQARGCDDWGELEQACALLTVSAAQLAAIPESGPPDTRSVREALAHLSRLRLPEAVALKVAEGYAYYALYPEL